MFYVIYNCDKKEWIWIKKKREAVLAAEMLSRYYDVSLRSSDGLGNYKIVPFGKVFQLSIFDLDFDEVFEKYVYHDGNYDFYAYRVKK